MISPAFQGENTSIWRRTALVAAGLATLCISDMVRPADAGRLSEAKGIEVVQSRPTGPPRMAVVSLSSQRVTIYDAKGWIMRAPVSSGRKGYETPAGIYAVIQKEAEHYSNLYDDGYMPHMQRITWSGIALHGGPLPGYAASHGCVRMPFNFAERLFDLTKIGMRVIVARNDPVPTEFSHPVLRGLNASHGSEGQPGAGSSSSAPIDSGMLPAPKPRQTLQSIAAAKAAEAETATRKADAARLEAVKKTLETARIAAALRLAESAKSRLELHVSTTQSALEAADSPDAIQLAEEAKAKALAKLADAEARLKAAILAAQQKPDVLRARQDAEVADAEKTAALEAAAEAARRAAPISVFISRKTQRLYVRQAFQPVFDIAVSIRDPDQPIGTHVFTALDYLTEDAGIRWNAVSMDSMPAGPALERTSIPSEALDRISELVSPGSSLIISDEGISSETANDTDFIILMSGEPQGGIKTRRRDPEARYRYHPYNRPYGVYNRPYGIFWQ
jgi:hypothetical protein